MVSNLVDALKRSIQQFVIAIRLAACLRHALLAATLVLPQLALGGEASVPITFSRHQNAITVTVLVNGKPHRFLIDTGADGTVVSPKVVGMNLVDLRQAAFTQHGPGLGGDAVSLRVNVRFAGRTWGERPVVVMDLQQVRAVYGNDIEGLLGLDLLREFASVRVDFKNQQLVVTN